MKHIAWVACLVVGAAWTLGGCKEKQRGEPDIELLKVEFVAPTDADGANLDRDWAEVAMEVEGAQGRVSIFLDWNETLVGRWTLDGTGTGQEVPDESGRGNDGVMAGAVSWGEGYFGGGLHFEGGDGRVVMTSLGSFDATRAMTIELWLRPSQEQEICEETVEGNHGVVSKADASLEGNSYSWQLRYGAPQGCYLGFQVHLGRGRSSWVTVGQNLAAGQWHHVAAVLDGSEVRMYLDGELTDATETGPMVSSAAPVLLGDDGWGNHFVGDMDEVRLYGRALTDLEVMASYDGLAQGYRHRFDSLEAGTYTFQGGAVDQAGREASTEVRHVTVGGGGERLQIVTSSLPEGQVGEEYDAALEATGGQGALSWSIVAGALPPGLTLDADNGLLAGSPGQEGRYEFTVFVRDSNDATDQRDLSISVGTPCDGVHVLCVDGEQGDDNNPGTSDEPLKTIQEGVDRAEAGMTVFVRAGTYRERVVFPRSGTEQAPIVVRGERGADGQWLTLVQASEPVTAHWEAAPEVGQGVYKTAGLPFEPFAMQVVRDGETKDIPRIGNEKTNWRDVMSTPADAVVQCHWLDFHVQYWDGIEAEYAYRDGTTYVRFRNGDDPNDMELFACPGSDSMTSENQGAGFSIVGRSYITIRDVAVDGAQAGVLIYGEDAHHIIVERTRITNGQRRMAIVHGAHDNDIRDNEFFTRWLTPYRPGAWEGADNVYEESDPEAYDYAVKEHIYTVFKHEVGRSTYSPRDDGGIYLGDAGADNRIYRNHIYDCLGGIFGRHISGALEIYENEIHGISSVATIVDDRDIADIYIHDNLLYDGNHLFRVQLNYPDPTYVAKKAWFYRNRVYDPRGIGTPIFMSRTADRDDPSSTSGYPRLFIYHNSFAGGYVECNVRNIGDFVMLANNIFSGLYLQGAGTVGVFGYNWIGGDSSRFHFAAGDHNIISDDVDMWSLDSLPDFELPDNELGDSARDKGIDMSAPFVIDGRSFPAMPGMDPGYFQGQAPDLGAVQSP